MAKDALTWIGQEVIFAGGVFLRVATTIAVLRGMNWLVHQWWGSEEVWNNGDAFLRAFQPEAHPTEEPQVQGQPQLILDHLGFKYYRHNEVYQGQFMGPCPIREVTPCSRCSWLVVGTDGRKWCSPAVKLQLRNNPQWADRDLWDVKAELELQYQTRVAS